MATRKHRYRITLEHLANVKEGGPTHAPLSFEAGNHDDLFAIIEKVRANSGLPAEDATAMAVGLKLFSEVMLDHRDDPLFAALRGPMREFIGELKSRNPKP